MMTRRLLLPVLIALSVAWPIQAVASKPLPAVINGTAPSLHPEGIAYDPHRASLLVSSVRHGTVSVVRRDGTVRTLVDDPVLVSTLGMRVDSYRRRLLVANGDPGLAIRSTPETTRRLAGLGIYDLDTGRRLHYIDLAAIAADGGQHLANDVALLPDGTAYVTDSLSPLVYRVRPDGSGSVLVRDERLAGAPFGLNGIAAHPAGYLLVAHTGRQALFRIPLARPRHLREVALAQPIGRPDGLLLHADGSLLVVQNPPDGHYAVSVLRPTDRAWYQARTVTTQPMPEHVTTAAATQFGDYVLSGRVNVLQQGHTDDTFVIRRVDR